ncbi:hypothetical protein ACFL2V_08785 [Pseudomonadota bacterium]
MYDVLKIGNIGLFSNPKEEVVFFNVDSPHLREVWWKPDYPIKHYGYNPHISIYRGSNKKLAAALKDFIYNDDFELLCSEFEITTYLTRQLQLLPSEEVESKQFLRLLSSGKVSPTFLSRLNQEIKKFKEPNV